MTLNMRSLATALSIAAATFTPAAFSATVGLTSTGGSSYTGSFTSAVNGSIFDDFLFTPSAVAGNVAISLMPVGTNVALFTAFLNGQPFSFIPASGLTTFSFTAAVTSDMPLELQVFGYSGDSNTLTDAVGSYSGTVSVNAVSAVPEPASISMLLLAGLALGAGVAVKRRKAAKI